jgi:hypothetical protein
MNFDMTFIAVGSIAFAAFVAPPTIEFVLLPRRHNARSRGASRV